MLRLNRLLFVPIGLMICSNVIYASPVLQHSHADRSHSHALPKQQKIKHRHGKGALGQSIKTVKHSVVTKPSNKKQPTKNLQQHYASLSKQQKQRVQEALAWVIESPVPLDLPFGQTSYSNIKKWQKRSGHTADGKLSQVQIRQLELSARVAKKAVNWTVYHSTNDHFQIGIPNRLAQRKSFNEAGGIEFSSTNKTYTLSLMATPDNDIDSVLSDGNSLQSMYQEMFRQFKSEGLRNIRQRKSPTGFMLSGVQNGEILYVNFAKKGDGHAGYLLSLPYTQATRSGTNTLLAVTALSFKVDEAFKNIASKKHKRYVQRLDKKAVPLMMRNRASKALTPEAVFSKVNKSVWMLSPTSNNRGSTQGSAVAINRYHLLTNCHVMGSSTTGKILHKGVQGKPLPVTLYASDRRNDRCVLKSSKALPSFVGVRPYKTINVGEKVYTIGAPQGLSLTIAEGLLSSKREDGKRRLLQTSAPISQGSSGGGLFDSSGNLLGITTLMSRRGQNLNFAIPAEEYWTP